MPKILAKVHDLLQVTCFDLTNGGRIPELTRFQHHFSEYRIVVCSGLRCDSIMFDGEVAASLRTNLLYDAGHYHVIKNFARAMATRCVCPVYNKGCETRVHHKCDASCESCSVISPCVSDYARIPCDERNRYFRSRACYENHKHIKISEQKAVCEVERPCRTYGSMITNRDLNHLL
jgi:hypothetical protein